MSFKTEEDESVALGRIISKLLYLQTQTKIFHWVSKSYGKHKALDELYDEFVEKNDAIFEVFSGAYDATPTQIVSEVNEYDLNLVNVPTFLKKCQETVIGFRNEKFVKNTTIDNIFQDLEGKIDNVMYLYKLE